MIKTSAFRIALSSDGISIWSPDIFGEVSLVRSFLARAFAVSEVGEIELRRAESFGRIRHDGAAHPAGIWKKLSQALASAEEPPSTSQSDPAARRSVDAGFLYLDGPRARRIRVSRIGNALSTWRVRQKSDDKLSLFHPVLRGQRDVVFRLEEELSSIFGVVDFRASTIAGSVSIHFDRTATTAERVARALEKAWPRLLEGIEGPPSRKRFFAALGLAGLAYTGQYIVPALRPLAVAGVTLYSSPNVVKAAKQLTRGEVGVSALYATGLTFMLFSGLPFTASVMASFMQLWPQLAHRKLVASQRRIFAGLRHRPAWARLVGADGTEVEVDADSLRKDAIVVVRKGEMIPVDGVVESGSAIVVNPSPLHDLQLERRTKGQAVVAGTLVRGGELAVRVERAGSQTLASQIASLLPHQQLMPSPSVLEADRKADRNAKPALALCAFTLLLTRTALPAQAAIRPDYATAPRLSAQLSAVEGIAEGLLRGVLFKNPAALDHLTAVDLYVIDATAGLDRRQMQVAKVETVEGVEPDTTIGYALAAERANRSELSQALSAIAARRKLEPVKSLSVHRHAGATRYRDRAGHKIEIVTSDYLSAAGIEPPAHFRTVLVRRAARGPEGVVAKDETSSSLWVVRNGKVIGVISFSRTGEIVGKPLVAALAARDPRARIIYASGDGTAGSRQLARTLGIEFSERAANDDRPRRHRGSALWIGDGRDPDVRRSIAASTVSASVAPLSEPFDDRADILMPRRGIFGIPDILDLGRIHASRIEVDYRTVYGANLLGVGGAFVVGLNTLHVGLLSNVGTGLVYARHTLALSHLASAAERRRATVTRTVIG
jgi:cation-transporting P-type ATPase C